MIRFFCAVSVLFIAACGGGPEQAKVPTPEEIEERIEEVLEGDPSFIGSEVILISRRGSIWSEGEETCDLNECELDAQETTLAALLGAEGFQPVETRRGVALGTGRLEHFEGEIQRYGGWLLNSAFAVHSGVLTDGEPGTPGYVEEKIIHSYSVGVPTGTNPVSGSATWTGVMVGAEVSTASTAGDFVSGDATLTVDFQGAAVDVAFSSIRNRETGGSYQDMSWTGISLTDGAFRTGQPLVYYAEPPPFSAVNYISGSFYGAAHREVGGVFTRDGIHGAFGGKR